MRARNYCSQGFAHGRVCEFATDHDARSGVAPLPNTRVRAVAQETLRQQQLRALMTTCQVIFTESHTMNYTSCGSASALHILKFGIARTGTALTREHSNRELNDI